MLNYCCVLAALRYLSTCQMHEEEDDDNNNSSSTGIFKIMRGSFL